jgi:hypothetical protein
MAEKKCACSWRAFASPGLCLGALAFFFKIGGGHKCFSIKAPAPSFRLHVDRIRVIYQSWHTTICHDPDLMISTIAFDPNLGECLFHLTFVLVGSWLANDQNFTLFSIIPLSENTANVWNSQNDENLLTFKTM